MLISESILKQMKEETSMSDGILETELSEVDGENGRLSLRGRPLEELVLDTGYEAMAAWLWDGLVPGALDLGMARVEVFPRIAEMSGFGADMEPVDGMRLCLSALPSGASSQALVAATAVALACLGRRRAGLAPVAAEPTVGFAEDLLRMRFGAAPSSEQVNALEGYLVTVAEHGMNASTYTARVVASTRASERAAVVSALGALQGPLHGGAPGPVLDMLAELERQSDRPAWLAARIEAGERLMGFGHRIYRVRDPRAEVLKRLCRHLGGLEERLSLASRVEQEATELLARIKPGRRLETNVEFYTALLLDGLGFERSEFTAVFACGRVLGWLAHAAEQARSGRLIRPESRYIPGKEAMARCS
jgi:citrate synthase